MVLEGLEALLFGQCPNRQKVQEIGIARLLGDGEKARRSKRSIDTLQANGRIRHLAQDGDEKHDIELVLAERKMAGVPLDKPYVVQPRRFELPACLFKHLVLHI
jgi:hypothetical protein